MEALARFCRRCSAAEQKGELGTVLADEVARYTIFDLQVIGGRLNNEVNRLPSPYREAIRPYFMDQIFGAYHELLLMHRDGTFRRMDALIRDLDLCRAYWAMVPSGCYAWEERPQRHAHLYEPRHRLFYYLVAGFSMFVLDRPGHPVGTPFPGGFRVEARQKRYLCPVRDREEELVHSICNYCPAEQADTG